MGRESQVRTLAPIGFKNVGLQPPKSPKLVFFGKIIAPKGYVPLTDFYQIWHGESFQDCTLTPNFLAVALKMWA